MKPLLYAVLFIMVISSASAATVKRSMPSFAEPGKNATIAFDITNAKTGKLFTIEDSVPAGFALLNWTVSSYEGSVETRFMDNKYGWSFTPNSALFKVAYSVEIPFYANGTYNFSAVWFDPDGMDRDSASLEARVMVCGDSICEAPENCESCNADCGCISSQKCQGGQCITYCGNNICENNENPSSCAADCQAAAPAADTGSWPFAEKKEKKTNFFLVIVVIAAVAALAYGSYRAYQKRKGMLREVKTKIKYVGEVDIPRVEQGKDVSEKEYMDKTASELPSFEEGEEANMDLPSLDDKKP